MLRRNPCIGFDFLRFRREAALLSLLLILISLLSLGVRGLNLGLDFIGGTVLELSYAGAADPVEVRKQLEQAGFPDAVVQHYGSSEALMVRLPPPDSASGGDAGTLAVAALKAADPSVTVDRAEYLGPQVGGELVERGLLAMLYALGGILIYVALRFEYRFAAGAVIALVHDVIITLGVFSVFRIEFDLTALAGLLAVIGYSLNDTIVIFDRIRENFVRMRQDDTVAVMNRAINDTMSRTVITSGTTLAVVLVLFLIGGPTLKGFSLALLAGIGVGTWSSVFIAGATALWLGVSRADLLPPPSEPGGDMPEGRP